MDALIMLIHWAAAGVAFWAVAQFIDGLRREHLEFMQRMDEYHRQLRSKTQ